MPRKAAPVESPKPHLLMKKHYCLRPFQFSLVPKIGSPPVSVSLIVSSMLLVAFGFWSLADSYAQTRTDGPLKVESVTTQSSGNGTLVSIAADGPLSRAQTWQDTEGYHVVLPYASAQNTLKSGRGIKLRQVGGSLEIVVQAKSGANVTVQPVLNRLELVVDGNLDSSSTAGDKDKNSRATQADSDAANVSPLKSSAGEFEQTRNPDAPSNWLMESNAWKQRDLSLPAQIPVNRTVPQSNNPGPKASPRPQQTVHVEDEGLLSTISSNTGLLVVLTIGLVGLLVLQRFKRRDSDQREELFAGGDATSSWQPSEGRSVPVRANDNGGASGSPARSGSVGPLPIATPDSLFGAYRIEQEVSKLVQGQRHRMDVLSSRAPDDRRAIETSLIKIVNSKEADESARLRAREALDEYGFVSQESAALLFAREAFERNSAARALGEIGSPASLPFLVEALSDPEPIVRNQAIASIGLLKLPSAVGALLDLARRQPDVPSGLLSRALSACTVDGLDLFDTQIPEPRLLPRGESRNFTHEFMGLEPASSVEKLPESSDDAEVSEALRMAESLDAKERSEAVKRLAHYRFQSSVAALESVAQNDPKASIRALAITSLAAINHESVFSSVLIAMAEDSREVRAAAARALSRLSFDRGDAYVRLMETSEEDTLRDIAKVCVKAGIFSQGIDRLGSSDRRQAYEAFSLMSLLIKAKITEPILEAITGHPNMDVRMTALRLLGTSGRPEVFEQLRELAVRDGIPENIKTEILETVHKMREENPDVEEAPASSKVESEMRFDGPEL